VHTHTHTHTHTRTHAHAHAHTHTHTHRRARARSCPRSHTTLAHTCAGALPSTSTRSHVDDVYLVGACARVRGRRVRVRVRVSRGGKSCFCCGRTGRGPLGNAARAAARAAGKGRRQPQYLGAGAATGAPSCSPSCWRAPGGGRAGRGGGGWWVSGSGSGRDHVGRLCHAGLAPMAPLLGALHGNARVTLARRRARARRFRAAPPVTPRSTRRRHCRAASSGSPGP
jgi:hypothetical protein